MIKTTWLNHKRRPGHLQDRLTDSRDFARSEYFDKEWDDWAALSTQKSPNLNLKFLVDSQNAKHVVQDGFAQQKSTGKPVLSRLYCERGKVEDYSSSSFFLAFFFFFSEIFGTRTFGMP